MSSGTKLLIGAILAGGAIGYLAYAGAANSWQYYLSVDEAASDSPALLGKHVRLSGRVVPGSLTIGNDRREATFNLQGEQHRIHATCRCLMPDNLAENIDVVVEGTLQPGRIDGNKVITRCASKYESKTTSTAQLEPPSKRG
jgi:cytochrome c-type biogenesis protein CcmE